MPKPLTACLQFANIIVYKVNKLTKGLTNMTKRQTINEQIENAASTVYDIAAQAVYTTVVYNYPELNNDAGRRLIANRFAEMFIKGWNIEDYKKVVKVNKFTIK